MAASREKRPAYTDGALREIAAYFLKLGFLGFGGPFAVIAAFQRDLVEKRRWVSPERFGQAIALIKAMPGPVATQLALYLGQVRGGRLGGFVAGALFVLPSFIMMLLLAVFYQRFEGFAWSQPLLFGMQSAALGAILDGVWRLSAPYRREVTFWTVAACAAALTLWRPAWEPLVILGAGVLGVWVMMLREPERRWRGWRFRRRGGSGSMQDGSSSRRSNDPPGGGGQSGFVSLQVLGQLSWVSLKAGAFVFGTGLAIVPLLASDVVDRYHWLTQRQFLDALAFGQITPGPVVITATFIGYHVAGVAGACAATFWIFVPAFFNILTWFPLVEKKLGDSPYTRRFATWAVGAVIGAIVVTVGRLATAPVSTPGASHAASWTIAVLALVASARFPVPVWLVIPGGGLVAVLVSWT